MLKRDETDRQNVVAFEEAVEQFGRKRTHSRGVHHASDVVGMEGVESTSMPSPPRKKARATSLDQLRITHQPPPAAPPSPLPSPGGSPPATTEWASITPMEDSSAEAPPFQPDLSLTTLMTLPSLVSHYSSLPIPLQSHLLLTLIRHSPLPVLRTLHSVLSPSLARDFLTLLPPELTSIVLSYLPFSALARASRVSKSWRAIIDSDSLLWCEMLRATRIWFGSDSEDAFARAITARRFRLGVPIPGALPLPHPYKLLFKSRHLTRTRWISNQNPKRISFPAHGRAVVTCLLLSHGRIISASDDHSIHVYSPKTGQLIRTLQGHTGGVWALAATRNTLVSGSTDRTVRIWNLETGRCTHVFGGHSSTVRCLAIIKPEWLRIPYEDGRVMTEKWPKRPLIVTGSRDHTLRVWDLPRPGDQEYHCFGAEEVEGDPIDDQVDQNPYHLLHLTGHEHAVRALAARGRTLVSGSYDYTVRIWDVITGEITWVLVGHTQKVYSVVLDHPRNQACSGSMDGTVRIWDLSNGTCKHVLNGHTSLVGLLGLSPNHLVSAAADSTLRVWDPSTGELQHTLAAHTGAITCFQHDEFKILSGSDGTLKMWDVRDGTVVRDVLTGITGVWQVVFEGRWCVAASNRSEMTHLDVWDFGKEDEDDDSEWFGEADGSLYDEDFDGEFERKRLMIEEDEQDEEDYVAMDLEASPAPIFHKDDQEFIAGSSQQPIDQESWADVASNEGGPDTSIPEHSHTSSPEPDDDHIEPDSSPIPVSRPHLPFRMGPLDEETPTKPRRNRGGPPGGGAGPGSASTSTGIRRM
ncbi:YVTN repeat-like/Quino protein amine dehydrogenase [Sistotremastrum suecicum HHB10207 ss-3]|uniref:YVTN repeat-like/Quino protein amine dehydrogenase n=1 Tax=Sistotremastrum suecicum HHB10207 ss-3 TaxID=1314776 RepID=A0A165ZX43_9AGAM|nr:YVTN repeat-like/Quino protein amine dehydrogenase [Sistotremastrum suecicum HHB10207 ss-3]